MRRVAPHFYAKNRPERSGRKIICYNERSLSFLACDRDRRARENYGSSRKRDTRVGMIVAAVVRVREFLVGKFVLAEAVGFKDNKAAFDFGGHKRRFSVIIVVIHIDVAVFKELRHGHFNGHLAVRLNLLAVLCEYNVKAERVLGFACGLDVHNGAVLKRAAAVRYRDTAQYGLSVLVKAFGAAVQNRLENGRFGYRGVIAAAAGG